MVRPHRRHHARQDQRRTRRLTRCRTAWIGEKLIRRSGMTADRRRCSTVTCCCPRSRRTGSHGRPRPPSLGPGHPRRRQHSSKVPGVGHSACVETVETRNARPVAATHLPFEDIAQDRDLPSGRLLTSEARVTSAFGDSPRDHQAGALPGGGLLNTWATDWQARFLPVHFVGTVTLAWFLGGRSCRSLPVSPDRARPGRLNPAATTLP